MALRYAAVVPILSSYKEHAPMAQITLGGNPVHTSGELPKVGSAAPEFSLVKNDLSALDSADLAGKRVILNIFPSIDTPTCAVSTREFNKRAGALENTAVVCVAADLPFAMGRFCAAEGVENVSTGSTFRSSFGHDYGVTLVDGPLRGVLARAVVVLDAAGKVAYTELVGEIGHEPNYDAAISALK
jgi:thioredoxin-dependent peroxiredoxin